MDYSFYSGEKSTHSRKNTVIHNISNYKKIYIKLKKRDSNLVDSASSIRLSQRLSHACLSINDFIRETANGSLYQL